MAITSAQRATAVTLLINNFGNDAVLGYYVPGLTSATFISGLVNILGTGFDSYLTECLNNLVTQQQANVVSAQAGITAMQAQIAADTVTP